MDTTGKPKTDLVQFAKPVLINMVNRPGRLRDSLIEISQAAGRRLDAGSDVHIIRPRKFDHPAGFTNCGFRSNLDAHLQVVEWANEQGHERILVMEDDLAFNPQWVHHRCGLIEDLSNQEWQLASLGYFDIWNEVPDADALDPNRSSGWIEFSKRTNGAHAYFLHHSAYDRWIDHLQAISVGTPGDDLQGPIASDGAINTFGWVYPEIIRLLALPNMVGTRPTASDITPSPVDRLPLVRTVSEHIRKWRRDRHGANVTNYS